MVGYMNLKDGSRVYFLPGVPMNAGKIENEGDISVEDVLPIVKEEIKEDPDGSIEERVTTILEKYNGRLIDASSVLMYALKQGKFDEFAKRLEESYKDFGHIHPQMMIARTDVTAFFLQMYLDLGTEKQEKVQPTIDFVKKYGPGLIVHP